eukprot:2283285-Amphidinium_carterae.1
MRHLMGCALTCPGMKLIARATGIRVFHVVCDRGMTASFVNALSGYVSGGTEDPLCVWHTAAGCSAHDIHNSVRWISGCVFQNDKLVLDNVYIAWACLRKGFYYTVQHPTQWLLEVLEPVGVDEGSR